MSDIKLLLFLLPVFFASCSETGKDFFPENRVTVRTDGVSRTHQLSETEKAALNSFISRHTSFWNRNFVSYAPFPKELESAQTRLRVGEHVVVIELKDPSGNSQYAVDVSEEESVAWKSFFP